MQEIEAELEDDEVKAPLSDESSEAESESTQLSSVDKWSYNIIM